MRLRSSGAVLTRCSPASWRVSWTSSSSVTAARTRPRRWPGHHGHPVRVATVAVCLQARRAAVGGRGGEGIPAVVPRCRRSVTWIRSPRRAGTSAVRGARRSAADPIRGERRVCAGAQLLPRSVAGSGRLGFALGCRRVRALCNRPEPLRPLPGRGCATTSGSTGCSTRARWRSSIVRRSWSRCRAAVAIFCVSSVVLIGVRGRWRSRQTCGTAHLRPWCPLFETWDALPWLARLRRSTRRRTPPSQQGLRLALALPHRGGAPLAGERWERDHSTRAA